MLSVLSTTVFMHVHAQVHFITIPVMQNSSVVTAGAQGTPVQNGACNFQVGTQAQVGLFRAVLLRKTATKRTLGACLAHSPHTVLHSTLV